jgi:hypothetical protein
MTEAKRQGQGRTLGRYQFIELAGDKSSHSHDASGVVDGLVVPGTGIEPVRLFRDPGF